MNKEQRKKLSLVDTDLAKLDAAEETIDKLNELVAEIKKDKAVKPLQIEGISMMKGDKGDTGEPGKDGQDSTVPGPKGDKGDTGKDGIDGIDGIDGKNGKDGKDGIDGKDAILDEKLLEPIIEKFDKGMKVIDGRVKLIDQRYHGGGLSKVSHDSSMTGSGTPGDPLVVVSGGGGVTKIVAGTNVTISPVGGTGDVTINATGGGTVGPGTTNELAYFNAPTTIASLTTVTYPSLTELSYVKNVTSAIQTQLDSKGSPAYAWFIS